MLQRLQRLIRLAVFARLVVRLRSRLRHRRRLMRLHVLHGAASAVPCLRVG